MSRVYVGAVGLRVRVQTTLDLVDETPTTCKIKVKKPSGAEVDWTATVEAPASGGVIYFDTVAGSLDEVGSYRLQALVRRSSDAADLPLGETATLEVHQAFQ